MTEDSVGIKESEFRFNADGMAQSLTYISCGGVLTEDSRDVYFLWKGAVSAYANTLESSGRDKDFSLRPNTHGGAHLVEDKIESGGTETIGRAELFMMAADSVMFDERFSDTGVEVETKRDVAVNKSYKILEEGDGDDIHRDRENVVRGTIGFRGSSDKQPTGTIMVVDRDKITLNERSMGRNVPVLEIKRNAAANTTEMVVYVEGDTGSTKTISVESKRAFWEIKRGLLWGDAYPYPHSVTAFTEKMDQTSVEEPGGDD